MTESMFEVDTDTLTYLPPSSAAFSATSPSLSAVALACSSVMRPCCTHRSSCCLGFGGRDFARVHLELQLVGGGGDVLGGADHVAVGVVQVALCGEQFEDGGGCLVGLAAVLLDRGGDLLLRHHVGQLLLDDVGLGVLVLAERILRAEQRVDQRVHPVVEVLDGVLELLGRVDRVLDGTSEIVGRSRRIAGRVAELIDRAGCRVLVLLGPDRRVGDILKDAVECRRRRRLPRREHRGSRFAVAMLSSAVVRKNLS